MVRTATLWHSNSFTPWRPISLSPCVMSWALCTVPFLISLFLFCSYQLFKSCWVRSMCRQWQGQDFVHSVGEDGFILCVRSVPFSMLVWGFYQFLLEVDSKWSICSYEFLNCQLSLEYLFLSVVFCEGWFEVEYLFLSFVLDVMYVVDQAA